MSGTHFRHGRTYSYHPAPTSNRTCIFCQGPIESNQPCQCQQKHLLQTPLASYRNKQPQTYRLKSSVKKNNQTQAPFSARKFELSSLHFQQEKSPLQSQNHSISNQGQLINQNYLHNTNQSSQKTQLTRGFSENFNQLKTINLKETIAMRQPKFQFRQNPLSFINAKKLAPTSYIKKTPLFSSHLHRNAIKAIQMRGDELFTCSSDYTVKKIKIPNLNRQISAKFEDKCLNFALGKNTLILGLDSPKVSFHDFDLKRIKTSNLPTGPVSALLSCDPYFIAGSFEMLLYDQKTLQNQKLFDCEHRILQLAQNQYSITYFDTSDTVGIFSINAPKDKQDFMKFDEKILSVSIFGEHKGYVGLEDSLAEIDFRYPKIVKTCQLKRVVQVMAYQGMEIALGQKVYVHTPLQQDLSINHLLNRGHNSDFQMKIQEGGSQALINDQGLFIGKSDGSLEVWDNDL